MSKDFNDFNPISGEEEHDLFLKVIAALSEVHGVVRGTNEIAIALNRIADEMREYNKINRLKSGFEPRSI